LKKVSVTALSQPLSLPHPTFFQPFPEAFAGVMTAAIQMRNYAFRRAAMLHRHVQRGLRRIFSGQPTAQRIADGPLAEQLQNDRQILPPASGHRGGDVAGTDLAGRFDAEILPLQIGRDRLLMIRIGRDLEISLPFWRECP